MLQTPYIKSDLYHINKMEILKKVRDSANLSHSFVILLIGSSIVSTLGLLLDSSAIVIGGMIISPLMWPLMHTSIGISYGRPQYIRRALFLLLFATIISILSAFVITYLSPIKNLNDEIISRTNPTLIDLVIALVAGGVAALGITQPRISESLAGVAIAVSLMPPVAVSGIGLALGNIDVFYGGFLLFSANVISIIFISILVFLGLGLRNESEPVFQRKAIAMIALILLIISIPLGFLLRQATFRNVAYLKAESVLTKSFYDLSSSTYVSNVKTSVTTDENNNDIVLVEADILVPEDLSISYEQRQNIKDTLESSLDKNVDLQLRLQKTISVVSKSAQESASLRQDIEGSFLDAVKSINSDLTVDSVDIKKDKDEDNSWNINAVLRGDPLVAFGYEEQEIITNKIEEAVSQNVNLNIEIVSRVKIKTPQDVTNADVSTNVRQKLISEYPLIKVDSIVTTKNEDLTLVDINITAPRAVVIDKSVPTLLEEFLNAEYEELFDVTININFVDQLK